MFNPQDVNRMVNNFVVCLLAALVFAIAAGLGLGYLLWGR